MVHHLSELISIGPAMLKDFKLLGIDCIADLRTKSAEELYHQLCIITGKKHDICVLDTFHAAIAQAKNPQLPKEQCQWWYWSRKRKKQSAKKSD